MEERGVNVDHATLNRWVIRYSPTIAVKATSQKRETNAENPYENWKRRGNYLKNHLDLRQNLPDVLLRTDSILQHPVFHLYQSETEMMRYMRLLANKDIALDRSMIPPGLLYHETKFGYFVTSDFAI
jgi:glycine cleavage system protein P-like pyridoxal-binding family